MLHCLIGMGANLGNRLEALEAATLQLREHPHVEIVAGSRWYSYPAIGGPAGQGDFLNGALRIATDLSPIQLIHILNIVERRAGRQQLKRWAARTLDCDLLLYGEDHIHTAELQVPHPRMIARRFVLEPAAEIAAEMLHPPTGWTIGQLLEHLQYAPAYFAVTGSSMADADHLARDLAQQVDAQLIECRDAEPDSASLGWSRQLEFARKQSWELRKYGLKAGIEIFTDEKPRVSNFWFWRPLIDSISHTDREQRCKAMRAIEAPLEPKLLMVTDSATSAFGQLIASLDPNLRVPVLHLSEDPQDAIQDAAGAVISMK